MIGTLFRTSDRGKMTPMSWRATLRAKGQLTLPEEIRTAAHLEEGDLLDAEITSEGILLRSQKVIDAHFACEGQGRGVEEDLGWLEAGI